jgi:NADPH:quinone reductase-like Zn-dependent oxidoreductase
MPEMNAVSIHTCGGPEVLQLEEVEVPQPAEDEVLIRVRAVGVNPIDYQVRSGALARGRPLKETTVLGRDVAGTIERCGGENRGMPGMKPGDAVYALLNGRPAGYAQYVTVKASLCAPEPRRLDLSEPRRCH